MPLIDMGEKFNLMQIGPKDLRRRWVESIERRHGRRVMSRLEHPMGEHAQLWAKASRQCAGAQAAAVAEGPWASSSRARWPGVSRARQAKFDMQLAGVSSRLARGAPRDAPGRGFFERREATAPADDVEVAGEVAPAPEKSVEIRDFARDEGLQMFFDAFEVTAGAPIYSWGDWSRAEENFGNVVYTDGSGQEAPIPHM
ncbi:unnamed protein product, partial [Prorocentrum cordatum]